MIVGTGVLAIMLAVLLVLLTRLKAAQQLKS